MIPISANIQTWRGTVSYEAVDLEGNIATGTMRIAVEPLATDTPPVAADDFATVPAGGSLSIDVLANDFDPESQALTLASASAAHGSASVSGGLLAYTAPTDFAGIDPVSYEVSDPAGNVTTGLLTITVEAVQPPDAPPVATGEAVDAVAGETVSIDVLANDTDPEGRPLTLVSARAAKGTATVEGGRLSYVSLADFTGTDTVTYEVADPAGNTASGTVTITVEAALPPDAAPVVRDDAATVAAGGTVSIDVLANDTDPEGRPLTLASAKAEKGTASVSEGKVSYTAPSGFAGIDTVTYEARDPAGNLATGSVSVTVELPDEPPVTAGDAATAFSGETILMDVMANDVDPEGKTLVLTSAKAANGTVSIENGLLRYVAPTGFAGLDKVTYEVTDPGGNVSTGTAEVTVVAIRIEAGEPGEFTIEAGPEDFLLKIEEPAVYQGEYLVARTDLAQGPVNLVSPSVTGQTEVGSTLTAEAGLWAYDTSLGPVSITWQWQRGGTAIAGADGASHLVEAEDATSGLSLVAKASQTVGTRSVEVEAIAPAAVSPPATAGFAESGVRFAGASALSRKADLGADSPAVLFFASFVPHAIDKHSLIRQTSSGEGLDVMSGAVRLLVTRVNGYGALVRSRPLAAGRRVHVLAGVENTGRSNNRMRIWTRAAGEPDWNEDQGTDVPTTFGDFTRGGFTVGAGHPPETKTHMLNATVFRIAAWVGVKVPDIGEAAIRALFVKPDGALQDPAASYTVQGPPRVDLYGKAADYAAGRNLGTAGNFDTIMGTFSDV